jgi:hypothetical protein
MISDVIRIIETTRKRIALLRIVSDTLQLLTNSVRKLITITVIVKVARYVLKIGY